MDIKLKKGTITIFGDIEEMPFSNYHKFVRECLVESGIEPSMEGILLHLSKMREFLQNDRGGDAINECNNLIVGMAAIFENIDPLGQAFLYLVSRVNGEKVEAYDDYSLKKLRERLSRMGLTRKMVKQKVKEVKKK